MNKHELPSVLSGSPEVNPAEDPAQMALPEVELAEGKKTKPSPKKRSTSPPPPPNRQKDRDRRRKMHRPHRRS